jgi:predicted esterase
MPDRPDQASEGVLVVLHGHDDDPAAYVDVAEAMAPPGYACRVLAGPVATGSRHSWWTSDDDGVADTTSVLAGIQLLDDVVTAIVAAGGRAIVAGFSQGGALALLWALRTPIVEGAPTATALAVLAGWLPTVDGVEVDPASCRAARVLIAQGDDDEVVAAQLGRAVARLLERHDVDTTTVSGPWTHTVDPYVAVVRDWLTPPR